MVISCFVVFSSKLNSNPHEILMSKIFVFFSISCQEIVVEEYDDDNKQVDLLEYAVNAAMSVSSLG